MAYVEAYYAGEALKLATLNEMHAHEELEAGTGAPGHGRPAAAQEVLALTSAVGSRRGRVRRHAPAAKRGRRRPAAVDGIDCRRALSSLVWPSLPPLDEFVASHPLVVAKQRDIEVTRQEAAGQPTQPPAELDLGALVRAATRLPDLVSFVVNIPLTLAPAERQDRETAAKQALVDKAEAELEEVRRAAAGEYAALASQSGRLQQRIERFQAGVLAPLKQRTAAALAAYRSNQASLVMLFEARHAEVEAQRKLLNLQRDLAKTQAQLVFKPLSQGAAQ